MAGSNTTRLEEALQKIADSHELGYLYAFIQGATSKEHRLTLQHGMKYGSIGSFGCGLGVKAARPDSPVISLCGDGGFGMTLSELSTAVEYGLNTVTIVMNNQCWGAEKAYQRDFFDERYIGADISSPPFDKVAELYGAAGYRVERVSEIGDAVQAALNQDKPAVIDIAVDPNALYSFRRDSFKHRTK